MPKKYEYYIPRFSKRSWNRVLHTSIHPGLALYRFFEKDKKDKAIERIKKLTPAPEGLKLSIERQENQLRTLKNNGYEVLKWTQTTETRIVCGLGIPSLAENGLLLDRVWGFPYVFGSALKGIAQDQALMELTDFTDGDKRRDAKRLNNDFIACFGAQTAELGHPVDQHWQPFKGSVIFMDAFLDPDVREPFEVDIINPHYGKYYSTKGGTPPADYLSPVPNLFLVLKENIKFHFALAAKTVKVELKGQGGDPLKIDCQAGNLCDIASGWLQGALVNLGIGGKTRVGYGYFRDDIAWTDL